MKNQLAAASVGVQGSGWGWLGYNKQSKKLQIATCLNQDPLQATTGEYYHKHTTVGVQRSRKLVRMPESFLYYN